MADVTFKLKLDADIANLTAKLEELKKQLGSVADSKAGSKVAKTFDDLEKRLDAIKVKAKTPVHGINAFTSIEKDIGHLETSIEGLGKDITKIQQKSNREKINFTSGEDQTRLLNIINLIDKIDNLNKAQIDTANKLKLAQEQVANQEKIRNDLSLQAVEIQRQLDNAKENDASPETIARLSDSYKELKASVNSYTNQIATTRREITSLQGEEVKQRQTLAELKKEAKEAGVSLRGIGTEVTEASLTRLVERLLTLLEQGLTPLNDRLRKAANTQTEFAQAIGETSKELDKEKTAFIETDDAAGQVNGVMSRIKQFTGLTGVALVMRRALNGAMQATKELDAQMTEMAVVTDLEVSDYWKQLPEHTARANALGVAIKDVYEAETLYYQQGLKTAEVTALSTSTLKMARIAGLSAEDATNKMTAALRGFNMEINQANADRIADVYSKLAAITASDTQEISTAMTKTASLASNAGMEFETTAALLAQIIETTRESAETAGTAMKTVIARFQELKKAPEEIGEIEGEIVDANKIETALRTIGVALRDARGQFRDLDEVFLELSSKWDSLDTNTQRYIATIAAGSRQQSRFIAMMSNYARTMELVNAANNAAGASNEQFEKTLSSLQSKLAKLKNAWDTFTQGIANNEFIKLGVDLLTKIMTIINKITEGWDSWSSSALKIGLVTAALIAGDKALKIFTSSMHDGYSIFESIGQVFISASSGITNFVKQLINLPNVNFAVTKSTLAKAAAEKADSDAQKEANTQTLAGNVLKASEASKNLLVKLGLGGLIPIRHADTAATEGEAAANITLEATLWPILIVVGLVAAAIAALALIIWGVVTAIKAIKANTIEGQIESQKEKIKAYNEVLDQAKTNLEGLTAAQKEYNELQETYQNLTRGTNEWREALLKANQQVMSLIQTYPMLLSYLERNGEILTINENGWNAVIAQQQRAVSLNTSTVMGAQAELGQLNAQKATRDYYDEYSLEYQSENFLAAADGLALFNTQAVLFGSNMSALTGVLTKADQQVRRTMDNWGTIGTIAQGVNSGAGLSLLSGGAINPLIGAIAGTIITKESQKAEAERRSQTQEFAATMLERGLTFTEMDRTAVESLYESIFDKKMTNEIYNAMAASQNELLEVGQAALEARVQMDAFATQLNLTAADIANVPSEWREALLGITGVNGENSQELIDEAVKQLKKEMGYDEALREYAAITGNYYRNGKVYSTGDITKQTKDTEVNLEKDNVWTALAQAKVTNDAAANLKEVTKAISSANLNARERTQVQRVMSANAKTLTDSDINAIRDAGGLKEWLKSKINVELTDDQLTAIQNSIDNASLDVEKYQNQMATNIKLDEGTIDAITYGLTGLGAQGMSEHLETIAENFGIDAAQNTAKIIQEFGEQLSSDDVREQFNTQVAQADWSNVDTFKNLTEAIAAQINITEQDTQVLQLWSKAMGEATYALATLNLENLRKSFASLNKTIDSIFQGNRNISDEEYTNLTSMGVSKDMFVQTAEGYRYLGQTGDLMREASDGMYQELLKISNNIKSGETALSNSINNLNEIEEEIKNTTIETKKAEEETVSAWQAFSNWALKIIAQARQTFIDAFNWLKSHIILPLGTLFNKLYDFFANAYNTFGNKIKTLFEKFGNIFIDLINAAISLINKIPGSDIPVIQTRVTLDFIPMETTEELTKQKKANEDRQKAITEANELAKLWESKATALAYGTDAIDITALWREYALVEEAATKAFTKQEEVNQSDEEVIKAYQNYLDSLQKYSKQIDSTLMSKALNYEELAPDVQRFQNALEEGNTKVAQDLRIKLSNAIADQEARKRITKGFNTIANEIEEVLVDNIDVDTLTSKLEQWAYALGFHDIDEGVKLLGKNFDSLIGIIEGDEQAWKNFQKSIVESKVSNFKIQGDIDIDQIDSALKQAGGNAQELINLLLDTGAFKLEQVVAKNVATIPKISVDEKTGYPIFEGTTTTETGASYWHIAPTNGENLNIETKDLGKGKDVDKWMNPYGWIYNTNQLSEATIRKREDAEWRYQRALSASGTAAKTLLQLLKEQGKADKENLAIEKQRFVNAQRSVDTLVNNALPAEFKNYIHVGARGQISIDSKSLYEKDWTSDQGAAFEKWVGYIEEVVDELRNSIDNLKDARDRVYEKRLTGRSEYGDLVTQIKEAFTERFQREIDTLSAINDAIDDAQTQLVDKLQEKIDDDRQARENEEKERELTNKQAQLEYLKASGSSQLEILKLEKEIANDQESYTDSLVDQSIEATQKANEAATKQRQAQIDIAQAQLDWWKDNDSSAFAEAQMNEWLSHGQSYATDQISELLTITSNRNLSSVEMAEWKENMENQIALAETWRNQTAYKYYEDLTKKYDAAINSQTAQYNTLNSGLTTLQNVVIGDGNTIQGGIASDLAIDAENKAKLAEIERDWKAAEAAYKEGVVEDLSTIKQAVLKMAGEIAEYDVEKVGEYMASGAGKNINPEDISPYLLYHNKLYSGHSGRFASGGLADFTGPAWLDGTPSSPEMVLNQTDTANFIELKNILADVLKDSSTGSAGLGNNYYNIDVHVDNIESDYDIDSAAARMRELIEEDAMYRNVNAIQQIR